MVEKIKHWYVPLILGLILGIIGVWMLVKPLSGFATLTAIFEWSFIIYGVLEIIFALTIRNVGKGWGWYLLGGIVSFALGVYLFKHPIASEATFALYIGFVSLFFSVSAIGKAMDLSSLKVAGSGWLMFWGILGLFFSFMLLWDPMIAGLTAVIWASIILITIGIFGVSLGLKLKSIAS